jgi:hypothetical protein
MVSYNQTKNVKDCIKKVSADMMDTSVLLAVFIFFMIYFVLKALNKVFYIFSKDDLTYYVIRKIASNIESAFQLYTGVMILIIPAWYYFERATFNLKLSVLYLLIAIGFLYSATFFEITDTEL